MNERALTPTYTILLNLSLMMVTVNAHATNENRPEFMEKFHFKFYLEQYSDLGLLLFFTFACAHKVIVI